MMLKFDDFQFDTQEHEWHFYKAEGIFKTWVNPFRDVLQQKLVLQAPNDLPPDYPDEQQMSHFQEQTSIFSNGICVQTHIITVKGMEAFQVINKVKMQQNPMGKTFLGTLMFPLDSAFCGFQIQCDEHGTTGMRENMHYVVDKDNPFYKPMEEQEPKMINSMEEYFEEIGQRPVIAHPSDDEKFDGLVPNHPLSRVRRYLKYIAETLEFSDKVQSMKPFRWSSRDAAKRGFDNMMQGMHMQLEAFIQSADEATKAFHRQRFEALKQALLDKMF